MIAHRRYGTWCLHSKGAVPGRGLNNNIFESVIFMFFLWSGMSSNIQEFFRNIFFLIIPGLLFAHCLLHRCSSASQCLMISDQVKKSFLWSAIISNIQQCFRNIFFLDNCWLFMAIADQGKKKGVAVSQRAIGFRFLMQRYYILIWRMLMFAHVCSYGAGEMKGLLSGDN